MMTKQNQSNKQRTRPRASIAHVLSNHEPRALSFPILTLCDDCKAQLTEAIENAGNNNFIAVYCPHYLTLAEVGLQEGQAAQVSLHAPVSKEEAEAMVEARFDFGNDGKESAGPLDA